MLSFSVRPLALALNSLNLQQLDKPGILSASRLFLACFNLGATLSGGAIWARSDLRREYLNSPMWFLGFWVLGDSSPK